MIYITGDKHGDFASDEDYAKIRDFCDRMGTTKKDTMIVLGDHGIRYYPDDDWRTISSLKRLEKMPITFVLIRGNHDRRVTEKETAFEKKFVRQNGVIGPFFVHRDYPSILFTQEYGLYSFNQIQCFVIGGAYSIDKQYRLDMTAQGYRGYLWFHNEQLSEDERMRCKASMYADIRLYSDCNYPIYILSHTCPRSVIPQDKLMPGIDPSLEDFTMEDWMEGLYRDPSIGGKVTKWFCGHYHSDHTLDRFRFMYHDIIELE